MSIITDKLSVQVKVESIYYILVTIYSELFFLSVYFRYKPTKEPASLTAQVINPKSVPRMRGTKSQLLFKAQTTNPIAPHSLQAAHGTRATLMLQITSVHWEENSR